MTIHSISNKGWVVIPAEMRKKYHLAPGTEVRIVDYGGVLAIVPAFSDPVRQSAGMIKTSKRLTQALLEDHRAEVERGG